MSLLGRLQAGLARFTAPEAPISPHSAAPRTFRPGPSPFPSAHRSPNAALPPPADWGRDPATGAPLPTGPHAQVGPGEHLAARVAHRHGWFPAMVAAGNADRACAAMDGWLRHDLPGQGLAWAHPTDLTARLIHWHAALAWGGVAVPATIREGLAGSAWWHLQHLQTRLPEGEAAGLRRIVHYAGMIVGGFTFTDLPGARAAWSEGLAGLRWHLPVEVHGDGSPREPTPGFFAEALWATMVARAVARAAGAPFPLDADGALARGARYLERLAGELGTLPPIGEAPLGDLLAADAPLAWSLWNLALAWNLVEGPPAPNAANDPRLAWLGAHPPEGLPEAAGKTWSMWAFRESGDVVAHMRIKNRPSRVVAQLGSVPAGPRVHPAPMQVLWDVGGTTVLADPGSAAGAGALEAWLRGSASHNGLSLDGKELIAPVPATLELARVDGKKARMEAWHRGWQRLAAPLVHRRELLLNQARLIATDRLAPAGRRTGRHAVRLHWQLGPGWTVEQDGPNWIARQGDLTVAIQLPQGLSWSVVTGREPPDPCGWVRVDPLQPPVPAPCLVGEGGIDEEAAFVSSFEVR